MKPFLYRFTHEPIQLDIKTYQTTLAKCVEVFSSYSGIQTIYQYGGVSVPGISDLDLLLVFDEATPSMMSHWQNYFEEQERYLLLHSPAVISPRLFENGSFITHLSGLNCMWGIPGSIRDLYQDEENFLSYFTVLEHTVRLLVSVTRQLQIRLVKQRSLLCELNSIRYDLQLVKMEQEWESTFIRPILQLRQNWFTLPKPERQEQLLMLFQLSPQVLRSILNKLADWAFQWNIQPVASGAYPTLWAGVFLSSVIEREQVSLLARLTPYMPVMREKWLKFAQIEIGIPPLTLGLLKGTYFPGPFIDLFQKRKAILREYATFCKQIGGGFGSLHVPPFPA